ncbi:hypothetical protein L914_21530 [Phytophthora nicotianae]|uniref:Uncharacterized protein n=1 Tax=Phytophthora nicotianae TaxID=4792 RepID=W2M363_PHYNI|nr:hypothetical protein L914_21530 [Phytophthora nicotianae]
MRTIPVALNPGESQNAYEAQFQNWVELPSYNALRASFSETDIRLERRLRLDFAKSKARRQLPGPRPQRHEVSTHPAPAASTVARSLEPAGPATGQSLSSAADLSSSHSSGKSSAPGDAVARHGGVPAPDVPDHKRPRRQGNLAGGEPQPPKSYAFHMVVELPLLIEQSMRRATCRWILALRASWSFSPYGAMFAQ